MALLTVLESWTGSSMIWLCSSSSKAQQRARSVFSLFDISYHVHYITSCSLRPPFSFFFCFWSILPPSFFLPFHRLHFWQRSFRLTAVKWWEQGMNTNQRRTVWERETEEILFMYKAECWGERGENRSCGARRNPLVSIRCVRPQLGRAGSSRPSCVFLLDYAVCLQLLCLTAITRKRSRFIFNLLCC